MATDNILVLHFYVKFDLKISHFWRIFTWT